MPDGRFVGGGRTSRTSDRVRREASFNKQLSSFSSKIFLVVAQVVAEQLEGDSTARPRREIRLTRRPPGGTASKRAEVVWYKGRETGVLGLRGTGPTTLPSLGLECSVPPGDRPSTHGRRPESIPCPFAIVARRLFFGNESISRDCWRGYPPRNRVAKTNDRPPWSHIGASSDRMKESRARNSYLRYFHSLTELLGEGWCQTRRICDDGLRPTEARAVDRERPRRAAPAAPLTAMASFFFSRP